MAAIPQPDASAAPRQRSGVDRAVILGTPVLLAVALLFHPQGEPALNDAFAGQTTRWLAVHVVQLFLVALLGVAVWKLLEGLRSTPATVSRVALPVFLVFFSAYDSVAGLATGILLRYGEGVGEQDQAAIAGAVEHVFVHNHIGGNISLLGLLGSGGWIVVAVAAAVALRRAGADRATAWCMGLASLFSFHGNMLIGPLGLVLFLVAAYRWLQRDTLSQRMPSTGPG